MEKIEIQSAAGATIYLNIRKPNVKIKGVVLINTGTCIPQKIYWKFAEFLTENEYVTITYDYSDAQNYTSSVSHTDWIKDMQAALDYVQNNYANEKKYIVGHSSGGQLIGYMKNAKDFDKLFLVASAHAYWKKSPAWYGYSMQIFWKILVPLNIGINGFFNNKMYGVSGGFPKNIILELRSFCMNEDFFFPFFNSKNTASYFDTIRCKVKAYHLADDIVANYISCNDMLDKYTNADKTIETLHAKDFDMKEFGHRGFFSSKAEKILWPKFLKDLEV
jgi:predicted alpha/beta hydrolase